MRRRALLANATALGTLTTLAGCLNAGGDDGTTTQETTTTESTTTEPTTEPTTTEPTTTEPTTTSVPVTVDSKQIQTETTACGGENMGSIEFTDTGVAISGSIQANTPCHDATYVSHRVLGEVVQVTVGTEPTDVDTCQSCIGHVEYTGTVTTNRTPSSFVLVHEYTPEGKDEPITEVVADKGADE